MLQTFGQSSSVPRRSTKASTSSTSSPYYGKTDKALNVYMQMQDAGIKPDVVTLINVVHCYGKAGMVEGVKRIHSQLMYEEPNEALYKAVIDAYKNANRPELAELVTQELRFAFEEKDSKTKNEIEDEYEPV